MILPALRHYISHPDKYTGLAAVPFVTPVDIAGLDQYTCKDRNDARRYLSHYCGKHIHIGRRPRNSRNEFAAVMRLITTNHEYGLINTDDTAEQFVAVDFHCTSEADAAFRVQVAAELLKLAVGGYCYDKWGEMEILSCQIANEGIDVAEPVDGGDRWSFSYGVELGIMARVSVPTYPVNALSAVLVLRNVGDTIRTNLEGTVVPEGRTLVNCAWTVSDSSGVKVTIDGGGGTIATTPGVEGTLHTPIFDRTVLGIIGPATVVAVVTDSAGQTSTATAIDEG